MNKNIATIIGCVMCIAFLVGLATTLTRSMMIGFKDVLPVYILMLIVIIMMLYEAFYDKKK
jgi:amino acid permease